MSIHKLSSTLILVLMLLIGGCFSNEKDPQFLYNKALEHVEKDQIKEAMFELRRAIQLDGRFAAARYQLGLLYLEGNEPQKAFEEMLRVAELDPANLDAALKVAQFYLAGGNREESRKYLAQVLGADGGNREALILLSNLELIDKNYDQALATLDQIGEDIGQSAELLAIRGRIFAAREEWQPAEADFRQAISLAPDTIANYTILLRLYEVRQEREKSKALLDEMIGRFPDNVQAHLLLAGYHRAVGEAEKSEELLQQVITLEPDNVRHRLQLAGFYRSGGKLAEAEAVLIEAKGQFSASPEILAALANLYFDLGRLDETRQILGDMEPGYGEAILLQAKLRQRDSQFAETVGDLKKLTVDYPGWADPFFYLGLAHFNLGEIDQAKFVVAEAIQKKKGEAKYHALMAQIHLRQNAFAEAEKEAVTALRLNPKALPAALLLSRALLGSKQFDKALTILGDIERQVPGNPEILGLLAQAAFADGEQEQGEKAVADLLERDPGNIQAMALVLTSRYRDDLAGGEAFIRQQLAKVPENSRLHLLLGGLLERRERPEEALAAYERAAELDEEDTRALFAAARLYKKLGKSGEAMAKYQAMVVQQPDSLPGRMGIAALLEADGDSTGAMAQYERILETRKDFAPAANNLAWLIASDPEGDLGKALMLAMNARQVMPDDPNIADTLGYVHLRRESYGLALTQFEIAKQKLPDEPLVQYHLAQALHGVGQEEKAREKLAALLDGGVDFAGREDAQAMLEQWRAE